MCTYLNICLFILESEFYFVNSNYPPYDPSDPYSQPTTAGSYPQFPTNPGQYPPNMQPGQFGPPQQSAKLTFKQKFRALPRWKRFGSIGCGCLTMLIVFLVFCGIVGNALPKQPDQTVASAPTQQPTHQAMSVKKAVPTVKPTPAPAKPPVAVKQLPVTSGSPILGADLSTFTARYGQPNDQSAQ